MILKDKEQALKWSTSIAMDHVDDLESEDGFRPRIFLEVEDKGPRLMVFPSLTSPDREELAWAMNVLCAATDATAVFWVSDTYGSKERTRKNGQQWGPGEMQEAVENQTEDAELIFEQLIVQYVDHDGVMWMARHPYDRIDGSVVFRGADFDIFWNGDDGGKLEGVMINLFLGAITQEKIWNKLSQWGLTADVFGLNEEERNMHALCAGVKTVIEKTQWPIGVFGFTETESRVLNKSLGSDPNLKVELHENPNAE